MKYFIFLCIVPFFLFSCKRWADNCDETLFCDTLEPEFLFIELQLSPKENEWVNIVVYKGYVDDGDVYDEFETNLSKDYIYVPTSTRFSVEATYSRGDKTIRAIDGDYVTPDYFFNCQQTCYRSDEDVIFDLKLNE